MVKNIKKRLKNQRGLTLVELLAVIVILGIVSAIAIPSIGNIIEKSKYDAAKADAMQVINAAKLYTASYGIPEGGTISSDDLEQFVDEVTNLTSYSVTVSGSEYKITAETDIDGLSFSGNTVTDIEEMDFND